MYKVFCDNTLICDSRIEELALINPVVKLEENKAGSFVFKIPPGHPYYDTINKRKSIVEVYLDDEVEPVFCGTCTKDEIDFYKQKNITCEGILAFLNDSIQRPAIYQGYSLNALLAVYIANHNAQVDETKRFALGAVTVKADTITTQTNMESTMKSFKKLVDDFGGFFRIRHKDGVRYIDYLADSMNTNSQVIKLGKNLVEFKSNIDSVGIATAIIPLGAALETSDVDGLETRLTIESVNGGLDYLYNVDSVGAYGWIFKTVTFDDVVSPEELKQKGEKYFSEIQYENVVIEAKAVDLNLTDKSIERFKLSDQIRVVSAPHGLNKYFRLTKQTLNLNKPESDKITLGKNEKLTLSARGNQTDDEILGIMDNIVPPSSILQRAIENATALITSAMGGYVVKTNNELLIMDTDNIETATKVWRWNINGLGYSSTGYNGSYALAMTMDGRFVADAITVEGLEVGKNVLMGENATISWENVSNQPDILSNEQVTQITKNTITTEMIKGVTGTFSGKIIAKDGEIGGLNISQNAIYSGKDSYDDDNIAGVYLGYDGLAIGYDDDMCLKVSRMGKAEIRGYIDIRNGNTFLYSRYESTKATFAYGNTLHSEISYSSVRFNSDAIIHSELDSRTLKIVESTSKNCELNSDTLKFTASATKYSEMNSEGLKITNGLNHANYKYNEIVFNSSATIDSLATYGKISIISPYAIIGKYGGYVGFFGDNGSTKQTVSTITSTSTATASTNASKINEIINALKAYNLIG
jgi:phage minor structural protein